MLWLRRHAWWLLLVAAGCSPKQPEEPAPKAVVVELAQPGRAAARAGLEPGDRLISWSRAASKAPNTRPAEGRVDSLFGLLRVEMEEAPRGAVTLWGERGGEPLSWRLPADRWDLFVRPELEGNELEAYEEGLGLWTTGDVEQGAELWRQAARRAGERGLPNQEAWWRMRLARARLELGAADEARTELEQVLAARTTTRPDALDIHLLERLATLEERAGRWSEAKALLERARDLAARKLKQELWAAWLDSRLAYWAGQQEKNAEAGRFLERAVSLYEREAPGSYELALVYNRLGIVARRSDDSERALGYFERCHQILEGVGPRTTLQALCEMNRGNTFNDLGELGRAEEALRRALGWIESTAPGGPDHAGVLDNLAHVLHVRGEFAAAEASYLEALEILRSRPGAEPVGQALLLHRLGLLAQERRDFDESDQWLLRSFELLEVSNTPSPLRAVIEEGLAWNAVRRGQHDVARRWQRRAVATREALEPRSAANAFGRMLAAKLDLDIALAGGGGDLSQVVAALQRDLALLEARAPGGRETGVGQTYLAEALLAVGRSEEALLAVDRALAMFERIVSGSDDHAEALHLAGRVLTAAGRPAEARERFCRAVETVEVQRPRLGGSAESRAYYEAGLSKIYQACEQAQLEAGEEEAAFSTLERGRARTFLALLGERDILPVELTPDLISERARLDAEYQRARASVAGLAGDDPALTSRLAELAEIRQRRHRWEAKARLSAPKGLALESAAVLDLATARSRLDPGTVLLTYSVGESSSHLYRLEAGSDPAGFSVVTLPIGEAGLRRRVAALRRLMDSPEIHSPLLDREQRDLGDVLLAPVADAIGSAERLLIAPSGPLSALPFAALKLGNRLLVEEVPLHTVVSATVYGELVASRRERSGAPPLVAFGDPVYRGAASEGRQRELLIWAKRGLELIALPESRAEVQSIAGLFAGARTFLGAEASEERVKQEAPRAGVLHLACHGVIDERLPLDSALVLSMPEASEEGREDGLLQAWEIFERLRLDADLVTLSACDTALGKEMGGEGLVGLTRAFQFAGARSVLASLWKVADRSTAELMRRFYTHLAKGLPKAEALRQAQLEMLTSENRSFAHPFHWAAFQLSGDWR